MTSVNKKQLQLYLGNEPIWWNEELTSEQIETNIRASYNYYNYIWDESDMQDAIIEWMVQENYQSTEIEFVKLFNKQFIKPPVAYLARLATLGCTKISKDRLEYLKKNVRYMVDYSASLMIEEAAKPQLNKTIPYRDKATSNLIASLDEYLDAYDYKISTGENWFTENQPNAKQAELMVSYLQPKLDEMVGALEKTDEQLVEAFSCYTKRQLTALISLYQSMIEQALILSKSGRMRKPRVSRKKKPKSIEKQVAKIRFKKTDAKYNLNSIDPTKVIGAKMLFVFNTKYRKLGCYVAKENETFQMKGTTLQNYDEKLSTQKMVRKPDVFFNKGFFTGNAKRMSIMLESIKSKTSPLNGRINQDTILLKAYT